ncbi:MAG: hypothetical protein KatS3mg061_2814 [Dehalococcoidia bacterium]|nr:MAG: hypothetical protein KatS3mg061_2814 [Dehalococcoidia bacterium]
MTTPSLRELLATCVTVTELSAEVERHLAEEGSEEERAELRLTILALRQLPSARVPRSFQIDELALQRRRRDQRAGRLRRLFALVAAAAVVLAIAVGVAELALASQPAPILVAGCSGKNQGSCFQATLTVSAEEGSTAQPLLGISAPTLSPALYRVVEAGLLVVALGAGGTWWWLAHRRR